MILVTGKSGSIGRFIEGTDARIRLEMSLEEMRRTLNTHKHPGKLLHLAANTDIQNIERNEAFSYEINVQASLRLLRAYIQTGGKNFYFASTGHVYGPQDSTNGCLESQVVNPQSVYAKQKSEAEIELTILAAEAGINLTILRIFSVFGTGMSGHYLAGRLERLAKLDRFETIYNADDVRDFSSPVEVASDVLFVMNNDISPSIINICSGKATRVRDQIHCYYPDWPSNLLEKGQSEMPILVGHRSNLLPQRKMEK